MYRKILSPVLDPASASTQSLHTDQRKLIAWWYPSKNLRSEVVSSRLQEAVKFSFSFCFFFLAFPIPVPPCNHANSLARQRTKQSLIHVDRRSEILCKHASRSARNDHGGYLELLRGKSERLTESISVTWLSRYRALAHPILFSFHPPPYIQQSLQLPTNSHRKSPHRLIDLTLMPWNF